MRKDLSEMTLRELWQLFPIILKEHNPQYKEWYESEKTKILKAVKPGNVARINHIGSSTVEGLVSKPTVDILLEVAAFCDIDELIDGLTSAGWGLMARKDEPMRLSFQKGYTPDGLSEKVFHLHVMLHGDWDELYFRDYLAAHPDVADEYGKLKLSLQKDFEHDRDGYTEAKTEFVTKYSTIAKQEFRNKYKPKEIKSK